jgi:RNA polymerase sigma-70 factor, ECF subfamily
MVSTVPDQAAFAQDRFAQDRFAQDTEPFRGELLAHCYRMLGSVHDAEDLVQETYLRAWRSYSGFEGRSSVRTWLYQIATNACLTARVKPARRHLPSGLFDPESDAAAAPQPAGAQVSWLQPVPDALVTPQAADPAAIVAARAGLRLALIAALQYLPARQRAVLILRDVLAFRAGEVAVMLGTSTASVKSALQRARARLKVLDPEADQIAEPSAPRAQAILAQYIEAFEKADAASLERLLVRDATLEATPFRNWFAGRTTCVPFLRQHVLGAPGDWRMLATSANGQPAAVCYTRDAGGSYGPYGIVVLTVDDEGVRRIVSFGNASLAGLFGGRG